MKTLLTVGLLYAATAQAQMIDISSHEWYGGSRPNEPTQDDILLIANSPDVMAIFDKLSKPAQVIVARELGLQKQLPKAK